MVSRQTGTATATIIEAGTKVLFRGIVVTENGTGVSVRVTDGNDVTVASPIVLASGEGSGGLVLPFGVVADGLKVSIESGGGEWTIYYEFV